MSSAGASAAAAAAAAAAERERRTEEEEMTPYPPQDLAEDWEFKILRSNTGTFKRPERLKEILHQEQQAGWVLVEKFDNNRIRLKRPASARTNDDTLAFDAYRTHIGMTEGQLAFMIIGIVFGIIVGIGSFVAILVNVGR